MSRERVQLILRSASISNLGYTNNAPVERTADFDDARGYISQRQSRMIWKNINLRALLQPIWRQGAKYILKLESVTFGLSSNLGIFTSVENDKAFNVFLSGFPFLKSYDSSQRTNNEALLCTVRVPHGGQCHVFTYANSNELTFTLTDHTSVEMADIQIQFRDLLANTNEPSTTMTVGYPHSQYVFSVYRADE
jgi:hypothetical protein